MVLHEWGYQEEFDLVSLLGTGVKRSWLAGFEHYECIFLATDRDEAGEATAAEMAERLPGRVVRVTWPAEYEDVGALGQAQEGRAILAEALAEARRSEPHPASAPRGDTSSPRQARQGHLPGVSRRRQHAETQARKAAPESIPAQ